MTAHAAQTLDHAGDRILIVDDEPMIREMLADYLRDWDFDCETATCGEDAVTRLADEDFILLVTDISMPGVSGLDLLDYVVNHCPDMAVIVITAVCDPVTVADSTKLGVFDYIAKPFDLDLALERVNLALDRRRQKLGQKGRKPLDFEMIERSAQVANGRE